MNLMDFVNEREVEEKRPEWDSLKSKISGLYLKSEEFWQPEDECEIESRAVKTQVILKSSTKITKEGKVKFLILREFIFSDLDEHIFDDVKFEKEDEAIEWAESECEFINECSKRDLWFDGRRYLWKFEIEDGIFRVKERTHGWV
jgi:hypothetical protein